MQQKEICFSDLCLLGNVPLQNAKRFIELGTSHVEFMMDGRYWDGLIKLDKKMFDKLAESGMEYSLHSPCWDVNLSCEIDILRKASLQIALDSIEFASGSRCSYLVVHPGFCQTPVFDRKRAVNYSYEALRVLSRRARESGVKLAIENVGYKGTSLYTYDEFVHLLDDFGSETGYLLDVGHAVLNGFDIAAAVRDVAGRLIAIHIHDNDGKTDQHLPVGDGVVDWQPLLHEIACLNKPCCLVLEYNYGTPLEKLVDSKRRLETAMPAWFGSG